MLIFEIYASRQFGERKDGKKKISKKKHVKQLDCVENLLGVFLFNQFWLFTINLWLHLYILSSFFRSLKRRE